ncbi:RNA-binding protein [Taibaiella koreensis]|uniref:RNA-binding protein n=1 Tax=Taibaiella koreensis TaxID=1268548 RepID=UPI000E59D9C5
MNIFISNLCADTKVTQLRNLFSRFGIVKHIMIIREGRAIIPRVCGWVVMTDETEGLRAIQNLDHSRFMQQIILVNQATMLA